MLASTQSFRAFGRYVLVRSYAGWDQAVVARTGGPLVMAHPLAELVTPIRTVTGIFFSS